jgi:hypothetical protein
MVDEFFTPPNHDRPVDASHEASADSEGGYSFIFRGRKPHKDGEAEPQSHPVDIGPAVSLNLSEKILQQSREAASRPQPSGNGSSEHAENGDSDEPTQQPPKPGTFNIKA